MLEHNGPTRTRRAQGHEPRKGGPKGGPWLELEPAVALVKGFTSGPCEKFHNRTSVRSGAACERLHKAGREKSGSNDVSISGHFLLMGPLMPGKNPGSFQHLLTNRLTFISRQYTIEAEAQTGMERRNHMNPYLEPEAPTTSSSNRGRGTGGNASAPGTRSGRTQIERRNG